MKDEKYLELLAEKYPTEQAVCREIINLKAILSLPKGTEHFMSDLHGEYEAFCHILNNCSGVIREKVDLLFEDTLSDLDREEICTLIYYPVEKLAMIKKEGKNNEEWYRVILGELIDIARLFSSKYTRSKVRKAMPKEYAYILDEYLEREDTWEQEYRDWVNQGDIDLKRGEEYASNIFNAIFGDHTPYFFNGNLRNKGYIRNVMENACVEVPVVATSKGIHSIQQITLPDHLALMVDHSARIEELAVQGALNGDPQLIFEAILFDPLTASVLSMQEIHDMVQEMLHKNKDYLTYFKTLDLKD